MENAPIIVNTNSDLPFPDGFTSLREAIEIANNRDGADVIQFASNITQIDFAQGEMLIDSEITIELNDITLVAGDTDFATPIPSRHFLIAPNSQLTLNGGILSGGKAGEDAQSTLISGGSIYVDEGVLLANGTNFQDNTAEEDGGAIYNNEGTVTLTETTFSDNVADDDGGAIGSDNGDVTITSSFFQQNEAAFNGGAIDFDDDGRLDITGSSFFENTANDGGAIFTDTDLNDPTNATTITNTTFSGNVATGTGGAIRNQDGQLNLESVTISGNTAADGGGVWSYGDSFTITNIGSSIIAGNTSTSINTGADLGWNESDAVGADNPVFISEGFNLIGDGDLAAFEGVSPGSFRNDMQDDIVGTSGALADAGLNALTVTDTGVFYTLSDTSDALNAGDIPNGLNFDQRGVNFVRIADGQADIGAIETQDPAPAFTSVPSPIVVPENQTFVTNLDATDLIDAEGNGLTYEFADGSNDNAQFALNATTGELTFRDAPDFEDPDRAASFLVQVLVRDSGGFTSDVQDISVTTSDVNEALEILGIPIVEDAQAGQTSVIDLSGISITNPEGDDTQVNVFIATNNGAVIANETDGVTVEMVDDGTNISVQGTVADIRDYLSGENVFFAADADVFGSAATELTVSFDEIERPGPLIRVNLEVAPSSGVVTITGGTEGFVSGGALADQIITGDAETFVFAGGGDDVVAVVGDQSGASGGDGDDIIGALNGDHFIIGDAGDDIIVGGLGADDIDGGSGNDVIKGDVSTFLGEGDIISGGTGDDLIEGGLGADVFIFATNDGNDVIGTVDIDFGNPADSAITGADFVSGVDQIELDAGFGYAAADDAFAQVSDVAGTATFDDQGTTITFEGLTKSDLSADDFILA